MYLCVVLCCVIYVFVCCVMFERGVLFCVIYVFVCCVLLKYHCHWVKPPFAVRINNNNNNNNSNNNNKLHVRKHNF
jgi:hypothetical protein